MNFFIMICYKKKNYLPFKDGIYSFREDGIYSFRDNKKYSYDEVPIIHFTYKINRNFSKFNKTDYDDLIDKVITPIYPDETVNANINSILKQEPLLDVMKIKTGIDIQVLEIPGKGTETRILRNDFGDFDLEFNAKCRIYNKFDAAQALSWVVNKKKCKNFY
jgi:hypothetical protein